MVIKQITTEERGLVVGLFDAYRVFYKQSSDLTLADNFLKARLNNNESIIFVALEKDAPIGFTQLYPKYSSVRAVKNWILNDLYVDAKHRRKGVGEALIREAMSFAKENNAKFVQLETAVDNVTAQQLYDVIGFVKQPVDTEYIVYRINV
ncbi:MAG: GNAT family N-acetyltransferase [Chitinophagaceae bacterium]